eukprot:09150.XXX_298142_298261_1 [CDS] Oithona nana genome sequencing.
MKVEMVLLLSLMSLKIWFNASVVLVLEMALNRSKRLPKS